jgi:hypothetical protein
LVKFNPTTKIIIRACYPWQGGALKGARHVKRKGTSRHAMMKLLNRRVKIKPSNA